jgi:hypothetical protein
MLGGAPADREDLFGWHTLTTPINARKDRRHRARTARKGILYPGVPSRSLLRATSGTARCRRGRGDPAPARRLASVPWEASARGRKFEIYSWLDLPEWERGARRLDALGLGAMSLLARAYRDVGQPAAALAVYREMLVEDPLDRRAHEGLLFAAAATHDASQVEGAWHEVQACPGTDADPELNDAYERLRREVGALAAQPAKQRTCFEK